MPRIVCGPIQELKMQEYLNNLLETDIVKILIFIAVLYFAHRLANMNWAKKRAQMRSFTKRYGIGTVGLIIAWWLITPSGSVDDIITIYLMKTLGMTNYMLLVAGLTAYLIYRLGVTLVIYRD